MSGEVLPGEATLLESWRALARTSAGARVLTTPGSVAAVFPAWVPLNNAIARIPAGDAVATAAEVARLRSIYEEAGVDAWAYWVGSPAVDATAPDAALVAGLTRDAYDRGDAHRPG